MARATTPRSAGSSCWSARAGAAASVRTVSASAGRASAARRGGASVAPAIGTASPQACADEAERFGRRKLGALRVAAVPVLELAGLEAAFRHHQAMRNAEELGVRELDA